jgi:hypothetical protein
VSDREDITELVVRFADAVNRLDVGQFESVWTPEATWLIDPPTGYSNTGPRAKLASDFGELLSSSWKSFVQLVQGTIVEIDGDRATARSYMTEVGVPLEGDHGYFNHGMYVDDLERTPEGWRFKQRRYRYYYLDDRRLAGIGAPLGGPTAESFA